MNNKKYIVVTFTIIIAVICGVIFFKNINKLNNDEKVLMNSESKKEEPLKEETQDKQKEKEVLLKDNSKGIPILYYHSVYDNAKKDEVVIDPNKFREQMKYLKDNGYITLTLKEVYNYIKNNEKVPEKSVAITFDDGWVDNYDNAFPVLKEFGFKATIFTITDLIDTHHLYLKSDQIKEMSDYGIDFGSHTLNHDKLDEIKSEDRKLNLNKSKEKLEKITQKEVISIAYPFGSYDEEVIKDTKSLGYKLGFTINSGWANGESNLFEIQRVYVNGNASMDVFKERINNPNYN